MTIVGTVYLGLVDSACMAEVGNDILCLSPGTDKIRNLNDGGIPVYEPGLQDKVSGIIAAGNCN